MLVYQAQQKFPNEYKLLKDEDRYLSDKFVKLCDSIEGYNSAIIAFSGGVDSSLLAFLCSKLLDKYLCITAASPTVPKRELSEAIDFAKHYNLNHRIIEHNELNDERFYVNNAKRCFYCKDGLFKVLSKIMVKDGYEVVFDGSNHDDLSDYRPGRLAIEKNNVESPLSDAKLKKEDIRKISKVLGLNTWNKPQMACLASRFPYGTRITEEKLRMIDHAEEIIRSLGYKDVRVRFHGDVARIEIGKDEMVDLAKLKSVIPEIKKQHFKYVALDLEGYRTGSLNE